MRCDWFQYGFILLTALWYLQDAPVARGKDRYYMMLFAVEGEPNLPRLAHTFAVFIQDGRSSHTTSGLAAISASQLSGIKQRIEVTVTCARCG